MKFLLGKNALCFVLFASAIIYIFTAFQSHGFYHADEHYQIIEFAGLKMGSNTSDDLPWEFESQIRSAFQPTICYILLSSFGEIGITDPYVQAFLLRLLSALCALFAITYFVLKSRHLVGSRKYQIIFYLLSYFLWFLHVISVRFSSETWAGISFLIGIACFFNKPQDSRSKAFIIGVLFGVSFLFRFQMAIAILGFGMWLIFINHSKLLFLLKVTGAFCIMVLTGILIDTWFYGELVFSPWNYFISVIKSGGAEFGASPWYYYLLKLVCYPGFLIGIPLVLSVIILTYSDPRNPILWIIIPFIFIHSLIPHKEERFLFPIVYFFPLMLVQSYHIIMKTIVNRSLTAVLNGVLILIFVLVNAVGIVAMGSKSAGIGRMEITKYIHDKYNNVPVNLIYCPWANPYDPWHSLPVKFYEEDNLTSHRIENLCELNDSLIVEGAVNLLVIRKFHKYDNTCPDAIRENDFKYELQSIPEWVEVINGVYKGFENSKLLELYRWEL